ncbi:hypothetical protein ACP70R_046921 [Stipagrostis hirtigluma subsp. patula]
MSEQQTSPPWSDLPPELVGLVFLRLPTRVDRVFFSAVCHPWRSAAQECRLPPPSPMPWLVLPGGSVVSFPNGETFQLPDGTRYHNSCDEWLVLSRDDDNCFLMNPFTNATMPLPSLSSYSYYDETVEVDEDCMVLDHEALGTWEHVKDAEKISVLTLTVCSPRLIAAIVAVGAVSTIALCRPGAAAWSVSAHDLCRWLSHMVFFKGKLYAIDTEDLLVFDIVDELDRGEPRVSQIKLVIKGEPLPYDRNSLQVPYLLESHGTLLLVRRKVPYKLEKGNRFRRTAYIGVGDTNEFEVFEAD